MDGAADVQLLALRTFPAVEPGDDLVRFLCTCIRSENVILKDGDILVIAQKIVSKAEGRYVAIKDVQPSERALQIARETGRDARHIEVVLSESKDIIRASEYVLITEHRLGYVMANAGVDQSNIDHSDGERFLLLPKNPDQTASIIRDALLSEFGVSCGVIINDSFGRPWRKGVVGVAIGASGIQSFQSRIGDPDMFGRPLRITEIAIADEIASAASLLMGQADERRPVVVIRGIGHKGNSPALDLVREKNRDLFR